MANQTGARKRKHQSSDFKRVKAKVGKRALKPANETSTEAKFTTINVGHQNVVREGEKKAADHSSTAGDNEIQELLSTRGRSLDDIVANLRHPAPAVRISAARGLKDAITRQHVTPSLVQAHLAVLMPVCGKCCIDEEAEVRQLALEVLREAITKVCSKDPQQIDATGKQRQGYLKPFMPLLMAHVTSALNSLDRKIQLDGTSIVKMTSLIIPSLTAPFVSEFLPAYSIILAHGAHSKKNDAPSESKRKKKARSKNTTTTDSPKHQVLQSLLALLKSGKTKGHLRGVSQSHTAARATDLAVVRGGRGINSLFLPGVTFGSRPSLWPISRQGDLELLVQLQSTAPRQSEGGLRTQLSANAARDLLGKLRDAFAEATQPDQTNIDLQELLLILECAYLFYDSSGAGCWGANTTDERGKVWRQYTSLIMSLLPISAGPVPSNLEAEVNLEICKTLLDTHVDGTVKEPEMLDQVISYLFDEVERCCPSPSHVTSNETGINATPKSEDALFGALERLLVISRKPTDAKSSGGAIYQKLVNLLATTFFSKELIDAKPEVRDLIARSPTTRRFALFAKEIFSQNDWSIECLDSPTLGATLCQISQCLATFLVSWGGDYLFETDVVVTLLHCVVRRFDIADKELSRAKSTLVDHMKETLLPLLKHNKKRGSAFEKFTFELQKKTIALVVIAQAPTQGMLDCFSKICARGWCSSNDDPVCADIATDIVQSMYAIRRTVPMQSFLGFVSIATGVTSKPFEKARVATENILVRDIMRFDASIDLLNHIVCQCGPFKVLPLMQPLLEQWLTMDPNSAPTGDKLLTSRAAISILASCLSSFGGSLALIRDVAPKLDKPTLIAVCGILRHLPYSSEGEADLVSAEEELAAFLEPFILLFQREDDLFRSCYNELSLKIEDLAVSNQTRLLSALSIMTKDVRLSVVFGDSTDLVEYARGIEKTLSSGSLERAAGVLRATMEIKCGQVETSC